MRCLPANNLVTLDDLTLIRLIRAGSDEALSALLSRYEHTVRHHAGCKTVSGLEPEDLYQEGLIGLYGAMMSFKPEGGASFHTYAVLCITRRMSSAVKTATRQKHIPLNNYLSIDDELNAGIVADLHMVNPEELIVSRENIGKIKGAINECLTSAERRVFGLYLSGASYAAMAKILNVSTKSVDNALQRVKRKLSLKVSG